jgi:diguanylate cyclase (GGDEF)-like protein
MRQAHETALLASRTDQLTGLPTCRHILDRLDVALAANEATGSGPCVAVIDIDHFKAIDDGHGHDAGDTALCHFAGDAVGRMGGEEFLLLPGAGADDASRIIDRLREGFPPARQDEN